MTDQKRWVHQPGNRLLVPVDVPELTPEAAIERSWEIPPGGVLLEARGPEWLTTEHPAYRVFGPGWHGSDLLIEWFDYTAYSTGRDA